MIAFYVDTITVTLPTMRTLIFLFAILTLALSANAQLSMEYSEHIKKAEQYYNTKDYKKSTEYYTKAFAALGGKGTRDDRYNAACSWALAGNADSAFFQLERIATKSNYTNLSHLTVDTDLASLHKDKRWNEIVAIVKQNKDKAEEGLNKPLVAMLDTIHTEDQKYRMQIEGLVSKYGQQSEEVQDLWKIIIEKDSLNLIKVKSILDKYGWLGPDEIGMQGNQTLFLVIQHSDLAIQQKYLPMMREAVKNKKASPSALALLEDRVALGEGRRQIYGSQIGGNPDGTNYVSPLEDPDNVDNRRAEVGLGPLSEYVSRWNIKWDAEAYKKELPALEERQKLINRK